MAEAEPKRPAPITEDGERPQKRFYRSRAHCNPLSNNDTFEYPTTPGEMDWRALYPRLEAPRVEFLDVGCGFGGLLVALSTAYPDVVSLGLEIRPKVCEFVRLAKLPKTKADAGDPQQVAFDDATAEAVFDTLLCGSAMDDAADVGKEWLTAFNGFLFFVNGLHKKVQVEKLGKYKVTVRWASGNASTRLGRLHGLGRWR